MKKLDEMTKNREKWQKINTLMATYIAPTMAPAMTKQSWNPPKQEKE